jgi:hypothetical protein
MVNLSNSPTSHKPDVAVVSTGCCPADWRAYWRARHQLAQLVRAACGYRQPPAGRIVALGVIMTMCPTCGSDPCANPDFCRACRDADRRKARFRYAPLRPAPPPIADLPKASLKNKNWDEIAAEAWSSPGWKQAALEYCHTRGNRTLIAETPPEDLARLRRLMSDDVSLDTAWAELNDYRNRPTPRATIEAVMHAVRKRGLAALKEPATAERLERCDEAAKAEIERRIAHLQD